MENKPSTARNALKWGLISGLAGIILSTIIYMTDLWKSPWVSAVSIIAVVLFIILCIKEFRTENGGFMSYSQGLGLGTLTTVISSIISGAYVMLYQKVIDPGYADRMKDFLYTKYEEAGMAEDKIEQIIEMSTKFTSGGMLFLMSVIVGALMGLLISLVVAAIFKKNKPVF